METKLGEIDRARAIYSHASQMCDPRVTVEFWQVGKNQSRVLWVFFHHFFQVWKDFEVKHGNEDTLREMLRIKRSVQAVYNTQVRIDSDLSEQSNTVEFQVNMMASAMMADTTGGVGTVADLAPTMTMGLKVSWRHVFPHSLILCDFDFNNLFNRMTCGDWRPRDTRVM